MFVDNYNLGNYKDITKDKEFMKIIMYKVLKKKMFKWENLSNELQQEIEKILFLYGKM